MGDVATGVAGAPPVEVPKAPAAKPEKKATVVRTGKTTAVVKKADSDGPAEVVAVTEPGLPVVTKDGLADTVVVKTPPARPLDDRDVVF